MTLQWWKRLAPALMLVLPLVQIQAAQAAVDTVPMPFDQGAAARVIQGYNGGTHLDESRFGLDLVLTNQETSGASVLSPFEGTVAWAFEPGDKTGCLEVVQPDRGLGVMFCHVLLGRPYSRGERISRGQVLGTVGAPGTVGNNGSAHVHIELHRGGRSSDPVPFSPSGGGLTLEYNDLAETGGANDHAGMALASSNTVAAPPQPVAAAPANNRNSRSNIQRPTANTTLATRCVPGTTPRFTLGFADLKARLGDAMGEPLTCEFADPNGTGDVHQQTTKGLAFWRKGTNTATFTNGSEHWGNTPRGWVEWTGTSVDPPTG